MPPRRARTGSRSGLFAWPLHTAREIAADFLYLLDAYVFTDTRRPYRAIGALLAGIAVCWFLYAPIHELLHAAGCHVGGGTVRSVTISPKYGASWYARWFPFVTVKESGYAGRLDDFDVPNDAAYLLTDYTPFLLTVVFGFPLVLLSLRLKSAFLGGAGMVLLYVPLMQVPNDFYEMGSIVVSNGIRVAMPIIEKILPTDTSKLLAYHDRLRSDDAVALLGAVQTWWHPLHDIDWKARTLIVLAIVLGLILGTLLALFTYRASKLWARHVLRLRWDWPPATTPPGRR